MDRPRESESHHGGLVAGAGELDALSARYGADNSLGEIDHGLAEVVVLGPGGGLLFSGLNDFGVGVA